MSNLNEAVRIAYQQGRKDALEEVRAEIEALEPFDYLLEGYSDAKRDALDIIDKCKGDKE